MANTPTPEDHTRNKYYYHNRWMTVYIFFILFAFLGFCVGIVTGHQFLIWFATIFIGVGAYCRRDHRLQRRQVRYFLDINNWTYTK